MVQKDADAAGSSVLEYVCEGFLSDPVQGGFDLRRQAPLAEASAVETYRNAGEFRPLLGVTPQDGDEAQVIQRRRAQVPHQTVHLAHHASHDVRQLRQARAKRSLAR